MKPFTLICLSAILSALMGILSSCSDESFDSQHFESLNRKGAFSTIIVIKDSIGGNPLMQIPMLQEWQSDSIFFDPHGEEPLQVSCTRMSDLAEMTISHCGMLRNGTELHPNGGFVLYLSWMDMDALTDRQTQETYTISIASPYIQDGKPIKCSWILDYDKYKIYPIAYSVGADGAPINNIEYGVVGSELVYVIRLTLQ